MDMAKNKRSGPGRAPGKSENYFKPHVTQMKKHPKIIIAALAFIILVGLAVKLRFDIINNEKAMPALRSARDQALGRLKSIKNEGVRLQRALRQSNELLKSLEDGLAKLEQGGDADEGNTEVQENALASWFDKIEKIKDFIKNNPKYAIPEFKYLTAQQWLSATGREMETEADYRKSAALLRIYAMGHATMLLSQAISDFSRAHNGNPPQNYADIQQYLPEDFDYSRYTDIPFGECPPGGTPGSGNHGPYIIKDVGPMDPIWDLSIWISAGPSVAVGGTPLDWRPGEAVDDAIKKYKNANRGEAPASSSQITEYINYDHAGGKLNAANIDEIFKSMTTPVGQTENTADAY
jgi:hypothetical protein